MIIKDPKSMYTLEVDTKRRIVRETPVGLFKKEDYERLHNDYVTKVMPALGSGSWTKLADMRNYKTSSVTEEVENHIKWAKQNGMQRGAIVVSSAIVKMQMGRTGKEAPPEAFNTIEEANSWLATQGF